MNRLRQLTLPGLLARLLILVAGSILLVLAFMFSVVVLAVLVVAGLVAWAYLWWRTRPLRQAMARRPAAGQVFEGDAVVVEVASGDETAAAQPGRLAKPEQPN